ncbi:MAG: hypothetical protein AAB403_03375 [Planctomycetota bacterium]
MSGQKWGESFLKSGLPLEHLTLLALKSIGWTCELHLEYRRENREGQLRWFEQDVIGYSPESENGDVEVLAECKYHDESRFWFFLPCETEEHLAQYGALSAGENLYVDSAVVHSAPYEVLAKPDAENLLLLAPKCVWGVTVSRDGTRQPNAVEEATKQLAFGFVPFCLEHLYGFHSSRAVSVLPVVVTSARLFRLRPEIRSLDTVRRAASPDDIADELSWLWYYHAPNGQLLNHNMAEIDAYKKGNRYARKKPIAQQLLALWTFPHWIAVANINATARALADIYAKFSSLPKDFSGDRVIAQIWKDRAEKGPNRRV